MIFADRKKPTQIIISRLGEEGRMKDSSQMPEESVDGGDSALHAISQDVLSAVDRKSSHDLMLALRAFMVEMQTRDFDPDEGE